MAETSVFIVLTTEERSRKRGTYLVGAHNAKDAKSIIQNFYGGDRVEMLVGELDENSAGLMPDLPHGEWEDWSGRGPIPTGGV